MLSVRVKYHVGIGQPMQVICITAIQAMELWSALA